MQVSLGQLKQSLDERRLPSRRQVSLCNLWAVGEGTFTEKHRKKFARVGSRNLYGGKRFLGGKMQEFLGRNYKLSKSDNFEEYMKALGVGLVTRKMGNAMTPVVCLTCADGKYTLTTSTTFKNQVVTFKEGEEFDEETLDGRKVKSEVKFEGNKMIQTQRDGKGEVITTIVREFTKDQMTATLTAGNVVCTRVYDHVD